MTERSPRRDGDEPANEPGKRSEPAPVDPPSAEPPILPGDSNPGGPHPAVP